MHVPPHDPLTWDRIIILHVKEGRPGIGALSIFGRRFGPCGWFLGWSVVRCLWSYRSGMGYVWYMVVVQLVLRW
jgi:hypothetical protein